MSGVVRGDQAAVDEPGARRRVGQRADDHQLVGVGDHHPFQPPLGGGVVVVRGAAQHRACARRSGRSGPARPAAPEMSPTSATRSPTTTDLRPSSRARMAVIAASSGASASTQVYRPRSTAITKPSTASSCCGRVRVRGREDRPGRTRTSSSSYSRRLRQPAASASARAATIADHSAGNSGSVLEVHATSASSTPGTARPITAAACAIRWSA